MSLECAPNTLRAPSTSESYCAASGGHPRMDVCCERFGTDGTVNNQTGSDTCHTWCELVDDSFQDLPASFDNSSRNLAFRGCLFYGVEGDEEFIQGPTRLSCEFKTLGSSDNITSSTETGEDSSDETGANGDNETSFGVKVSRPGSIKCTVVMALVLSVFFVGV